MSENRSRSVTGDSAVPRSTPRDLPRRYVLPVAGGISVALGVSLTILAKFPGDVYLPLLLVGLGVGALVTALSPLDTQIVSPVVAAAPAERYIADTLVICPSCSARSFGAISTPSSTPPVATTSPPATETWRVLDLPRDSVIGGPSHASAALAADFLWETWASETGRLPVELVGPVAETAYVPPRPGAPRLYEEGEPVFMEAIASTAPAPETRDSVALGPSASSEASMVGPEIEDSESTAVMGMSNWKGLAVSTLEYSSTDVVLWEAMNPTPPHLRAPSKPRTTSASVSRPSRAQAIPSDQCGDCAEPMPDPATWRRCLECGHALCAGCMVNALVTRERPWCSRCSEGQNLVAQ
jgi:hypothetical protein